MTAAQLPALQRLHIELSVQDAPALVGAVAAVPALSVTCDQCYDACGEARSATPLDFSSCAGMRELSVHIDTGCKCQAHAVTGLPPLLRRLSLSGDVFLSVEALPPTSVHLRSKLAHGVPAALPRALETAVIKRAPATAQLQWPPLLRRLYLGSRYMAPASASVCGGGDRGALSTWIQSASLQGRSSAGD